MKDKFPFGKIALILVVLAVFVFLHSSGLINRRTNPPVNICINNLRQLDAAKQEWASKQGKSQDAVPTKDDLMPYLRQWPVCPSGGTYTIGPVSEPPKCSLPGHELP